MDYLSSDEPEVFRGRRFRCATFDCNQSFDTQQALDKHERKVHQDRLHQCPHCPQSFATALGASLHIGKAHKPKAFKCSIGKCQKEFAEQKHLSRHLKDHKEKPFQCLHLDCYRLFTTESELAAHRNVHVGDRVLECSICHKKYKNQSSLKFHIRNAHPAIDAPAVTQQEETAKVAEQNLANESINHIMAAKPLAIPAWTTTISK